MTRRARPAWQRARCILADSCWSGAEVWVRCAPPVHERAQFYETDRQRVGDFLVSQFYSPHDEQQLRLLREEWELLGREEDFAPDDAVPLVRWWG